MQIVRCGRTICWTELGQVGCGSSVTFRRPFHQEVCENEVFIVTKVCSSYWPDRVDSCNKTAVTNLRTGKISYVDSEREVTKVHARVHIGNDD